MNLILNQLDHSLTIHDQYDKGIELNINDLNNVERMITVQKDKVLCVYYIDLSEPRYHDSTNQLILKSIIKSQDLSSCLINQDIHALNTSNDLCI